MTASTIAAPVDVFYPEDRIPEEHIPEAVGQLHARLHHEAILQIHGQFVRLGRLWQRLYFFAAPMLRDT